MGRQHLLLTTKSSDGVVGNEQKATGGIITAPGHMQLVVLQKDRNITHLVTQKSQPSVQS